MEKEQKKIVERLVIVTAVLALVIALAYIAYRPGKPVPVSQTTKANVSRPPILKAQSTAIFALFRAGEWLIDANGNGVLEGPAGGDADFILGEAGDIPLSGYWEGASAPSIGVFRNGRFYLLIEGKVAIFDFGGPGDTPVVGDWNGDGHTKIGVYNKGFWILDFKGDGQRSGATRVIALGGNPDEMPVVGDWNGDGRSKVGVYNSGVFSLDFDGNGIWDKNDKMYYLGNKGDTPVVGDWNGDGHSKVGVFHKGFWQLDYNGNGKWDDIPKDRLIALGGVPGELPVVGDWNGDGRTKVGVDQPPGSFHLDSNGNSVWDEKDKIFTLGLAGDIPVVLNPIRAKK